MGIRRKRKNILDPYETQIREMAMAGMSYAEISDAVNELMWNDNPETDVFISSQRVGYFMRNKGIRSLVTCGNRYGRIDIPVCQECEHYLQIMSSSERSYHKVCMQEKHAMLSTCMSSPMWCPKREVNINAEENTKKQIG